MNLSLAFSPPGVPFGGRLRIRASYSNDRPMNQSVNYLQQQQPPVQRQAPVNQNQQQPPPMYQNQPPYQNQQQQQQQQPPMYNQQQRAVNRGPPVNSRGRPMPRAEPPPPKVRTWPEDDMRGIFEDWAKRMDKRYPTPEEREYRYGCFKEMFLKVNQHHPERQETIDRLNNYADFTIDELYDFICKRD